MKPRSYPIKHALLRTIGKVVAVGIAILVLVLLLDLIRLGLLIYQLHHIAGFIYGGVVLLLVLVGVIRLGVARASIRTLFAPRLPSPERATYRDLKRYVLYLIALLKRASNHPCLTTEQAKNVRQHAYDLESVLGAHPLLDDLRRSIGRTHDEAWQLVTEHFDREALQFARYKMQAVVRDAIEPPFPVIQPLLLVYHQITLIACIVDCYVTRPTLMEYFIVIRDTWRVIFGGEYYRIGQRLFDGIYRNSPPMGPAAEDLGQALSVIWLTWTTAQAAMHRCRHYGPWTVEHAMRHLDHLTIDSLLVTRDTLMRDVLPMLKLRLRHSVGPAVADAAGFTEDVMEGIAKSVDGVIQGLRTQAPEQTAEHSRRSLHGLSPTAHETPRREGRHSL